MDGLTDTKTTTQIDTQEEKQIDNQKISALK